MISIIIQLVRSAVENGIKTCDKLKEHRAIYNDEYEAHPLIVVVSTYLFCGNVQNGSKECYANCSLVGWLAGIMW